MQNEARKMWHDDALKVNCTCVRVPIWRSRSESLTIECDNEVDVYEAREFIQCQRIRQIKT